MARSCGSGVVLAHGAVVWIRSCRSWQTGIRCMGPTLNVLVQLFLLDVVDRLDALFLALQPLLLAGVDVWTCGRRRHVLAVLLLRVAVVVTATRPLWVSLLHLLDAIDIAWLVHLVACGSAGPSCG